MPDVLRASQELSLVRLKNAALAADVVRAREAFAVSLGLPSPAGASSKIELSAALQGLQRSCRAVPAHERSDVRAAAVAVATAERDVKSSTLAHLPTIDAVSSVVYASDTVIAIPERVNLSLNGLHTTWTVGGVLTLPLYDGGVRYGQRKESLGKLQIAQARLRRATEDATREATEAEQLIAIARERSVAARANRELAAEAARLTKFGFSNGHGTSFDLLETDRRLWIAEDDALVSEAALVSAQMIKLLVSSDCR